MNRVVASDAPQPPYSGSYGNIYNKLMAKGSVAEELSVEQPPLGTKFKSYELNQAVNYYTLDPFQYNITKFDYNFPDKQKNKFNSKNERGLVYKDIDFEKLLPAYTQTKRSVNDFTAQDYHRFQANNGYFNPKEGTDNSDLWYYGASNNARTNGVGIAGAPLNVQETNHIIFPEAQRGGTDTKNLAKYSWSNYTPTSTPAWEGQNNFNINNNGNCQFFNYNSGYNTNRNIQSFNNVYQFDSRYCRDIGISEPYGGSMPFNQK